MEFDNIDGGIDELEEAEYEAELEWLNVSGYPYQILTKNLETLIKEIFTKIIKSISNGDISKKENVIYEFFDNFEDIDQKLFAGL
jgi:hypothetical protein